MCIVKLHPHQIVSNRDGRQGSLEDEEEVENISNAEVQNI